MFRCNLYRILAALMILAPALSNAEPAGTVEFLKGRVFTIDAQNRMRPVAAESEVHEGETIITGRAGELHLRMVDGAMIAVRPDSRLKLERYRAEGGEHDGAFFELIKGAMRSVTGWIGQTRKDRYRIKTVTATIGVRGTDHETAVVERNAAARKLFGEPGTYDKVNDGSTVMQNRRGQLVLQKSQAGFVGFGDKAPRRLNKVPDLFKPTANEQRFDRRKIELRRQPPRVDSGGGPHVAPAPPAPGAGGGPHTPVSKPPPPGAQVAPSQQKVLTPAPAKDEPSLPGGALKKPEPPPPGGKPGSRQAPDTRSLKPQGGIVEPPPPSMNKSEPTIKLPPGGKADRKPARLPAVQMKMDEKMKSDDFGVKPERIDPESVKRVNTPETRPPAVKSAPGVRKPAGGVKPR